MVAKRVSLICFNMNKIDLTVITVCRNAASTLQRCIDSVSSLLHHPNLVVEHLIVDGSSTDGTMEIVENQYKEGKITRYISEPDSGIYDAMNKGIALAEGLVCVFINADDEIIASAVESCCAPILAGKVDYTVSSACILSKEGNIEGIMKPDFSEPWISTPYSHQSMFCRTEMLRREGGFRLDFPISADCALMWHLYKKQYALSVVDVLSANFYCGGASSGRSLYRDHLSIFLENADEILQEASTNAKYAKSALKHLRSYMRFSLEKVDSLPLLVIKAAELHKKIANTMPKLVRLIMQVDYRLKAAVNNFRAIFSKKRRSTRQDRARIYSYLSRYC